jgi:hypothetical protein
MALLKGCVAPGFNVKPIRPDEHYFEGRIRTGDRIVFHKKGGAIFFVDVVTRDDFSGYGRRPQPHRRTQGCAAAGPSGDEGPSGVQAKLRRTEAADECDRDEPGGGCSRCSRMGLCPSCGSGSPWRCGCDVPSAPMGAELPSRRPVRRHQGPRSRRR